MKKRIIVLSLFFVLMQLQSCGSCIEHSTETPKANQTASTSTSRETNFVEDDELNGLKMILRETGKSYENEKITSFTKGKPLANKAVNKLLSRVEPLKINSNNKQDFAFSKSSKPAPRTGETIDMAFPSLEKLDEPKMGKPGELEVLRFAPEGDISMAPHLSITFSRPMVAISSLNEVEKTKPVQLTPLPKGEWRWLGTRTLLFKPDKRFPMATDYKITIPSKTKSATGDLLKKEKTFKFSTPPISIKNKFPQGGPFDLAPVIYIEFDQKINQQQLLPFIKLKYNNKKYPLRLATKEEVKNDKIVNNRVLNASEGRFIALKFDKKLPAGTSFDVIIEAGSPSAEGSRKTKTSMAFNFFTYKPFKLVKYRCGWNNKCKPGTSWIIEFNNPLDSKDFDEKLITIEPKVSGISIISSNDNIHIAGTKQGRTKYTVTIDSSVKDRFGQSLGKNEKIIFEVGSANPTLFGPDRQIVTLDPSGPKAMAIHSINHKKLKVKINKVKPEDWANWIDWQQKYRYDDKKPGPMPGQNVFDDKIKVENKPEEMVQTLIDFSKYIQKDYGQFIVKIEQNKQPKNKWDRQELFVWVQVTNLGVSAFVDSTQMLAWVTTLRDGKAVKNAQLSLFPKNKIKAISDEVGLAKIKLEREPKDQQILVVQKNGDMAILPSSISKWSNGERGWQSFPIVDSMRWYVFDDRGMYKPGEKARVKGWIRQIEKRKGGGVKTFDQKPKHIKWKFTGPRGNKISEGTTNLSSLNGFDISLQFPQDVNLGNSRLTLTAVGINKLENITYHHVLQVQEFRRPEFEVITTAQEGPYLLGEEVITTVQAKYYAGGRLPSAPVYWKVNAKDTSYTPPNMNDYQFGAWNPWWGSFRNSASYSDSILKGKTDALGNHHLGIHFEALNPIRPMLVTAQVDVEDVNRQSWASSKSLLVHPSNLYVGLKTKSSFVEKEKPINVGVIVSDIDGKINSGVKTKLTMSRIEKRWRSNKYEEIEHQLTTCEFESAKESHNCIFKPNVGGSYKIIAQIKDRQGRRNETEIRVWVAGGEMLPKQNIELEELTLIPEKQEYQPGDIARFMVQSPFYPAQGVLTVRRQGIVKTETFILNEPTKTFELKILEEYMPQVTVQVDISGSALRNSANKKEQNRRVAFAKGNITFKVPAYSKTLEVQATPRKNKIDPGGKTKIDLIVKDAKGNPVKNAELVVVVVDEAILALSNYKLPNPIDAFYFARDEAVNDYYSRHQVLLFDTGSSDLVSATQNHGSVYGRGGGRDEGTYITTPSSPMMANAPVQESTMALGGVSDSKFVKAKLKKGALENEQSDKNGINGKGSKISVRSDFNALALFAPKIKTNSKGKATIDLKLPDSLTRYRISVVAANGDSNFGTGESNITARLSLMVRPSAPRFLNFGDKFELPIVVQNQTDEPMAVKVAVKATNISFAKTLEAAQLNAKGSKPSIAGQEVIVPANNRIELRFPAATQMAGKAQFQVVASSKNGQDAATFDLPVWTPATSESFATYGTIDSESNTGSGNKSIVQPVRAPGKVWPQFGGLEIATSSTQLQALTDAIIYLVSYPFNCNEQISSRILAIAALQDVLDAFKSDELPSKEKLQSFVHIDLERLAQRQNNNGGFAFWRKGDRDWPYLTVHIANALARSKLKGYKISDKMWNRSMNYLKHIEKHIPHWYSIESKLFINAYAINVLYLMGEKPVKKAHQLFNEATLKKLPLEALGFILPVLNEGKNQKIVTSILNHLNNKITETASGAHFVTSYSDGAHVLLHSDRRADGILLEALIQVDKQNDVIPKIVNSLLAHRKKGRWSSTQENAFVLLALDKYFNVYENINPNFIARVWLNDNFAGEHKFKGRSTKRAQIKIPMNFVAKTKGDQSLILQKDGEGRLYYRIGMKYAPKNLKLEAADYGFAVDRIYEAIDNVDDVKRDKNGTWRIKAGAKVRVRLTMVATSQRYHVALVDPLPAGFETLNPALATSGSIPEDPNANKNNSNRYWWWSRPWYEHQNMRDERVEAFSSLLHDGVHEYTYVARATTPGVFVVPPTKAEEMYNPETFGRSASDQVIVE